MTFIIQLLEIHLHKLAQNVHKFLFNSYSSFSILFIIFCFFSAFLHYQSLECLLILLVFSVNKLLVFCPRSFSISVFCFFPSTYSDISDYFFLDSCVENVHRSLIFWASSTTNCNNYIFRFMTHSHQWSIYELCKIKP